MHALNVSSESSPCTQSVFTLQTLVHKSVGKVFTLDMTHHFWLRPLSKLLADLAKVSILTDLLRSILIKVLK